MNKTTYSIVLATILSVSGIMPVFADGESIADFVDPDKDPAYYLDRYYNESAYKSWFDRNYPEYTIEEAVGIIDDKNTLQEMIMKKQIIPDAEAESLSANNTVNSQNGDIAQLVLAIGGLGILFGAVLGIKRKVDNNSRQISINADSIKQKLFGSIKNTKPIDILQTRLAKGEITVEKYNMLKRKLNRV